MRLKTKLAITLVATLASTSLWAGTYTFAHTPNPTPSPSTVTGQVRYQQPAGDTTQETEIQLDLPAGFIATVGVPNPAGTTQCVIMNAGTRIRAVPPSGGGAPLAEGTYGCDFTITVPAGQTAGPKPLTVVAGFPECNGAPAPAVCAAPVNPTITIGAGGGGTAPTVGPLAPTTLTGGSGSVPVNVLTAGTAGGSLALSCSIPATAPSNFTITAGALRTINAPATVGANAPAIALTCVPQAAATTATLTCTQDATPDPDPAALTAVITCPAAVVGPTPEFSSVPVAPGPVTLAGTVGGPAATATITVTNTEVGSPNLTLATSGLVAPLSVSPANGSVAAGASQAFTVSCATTAMGTFNQMLTFTTNDPDDGEGTVVFNVNCTIAAAPVATPEFTSMPPAGTTITLNGSTGGTSPTSLVTVTNSEPATTLIVSAAITGAGLSVAPAGPVNIAGGASQAFTVSCATATAGTVNGVLTFTTNDPDDGEGTVTYPVTCNIITGGAQATAVPTLSTSGKLIAIFSVLGLGLLGFAVSRRT